MKKLSKKTEITFESAIAFCQRKIEIDANEIGLEIEPSHKDFKTSDLVLILMVYTENYIKRYESHLEAINSLYGQGKPINYKNMRRLIDGFDVNDFIQYIKFQEEYEAEEAHLNYMINMAENVYCELHLPF